MTITSNPNNRTEYLEQTAMDHGYRNRRLSPTSILIGEWTDNNDQTVDVNLVLEELYITTDESYYNRSRSLQDQRNRLWVVIGMDTIDELKIKIDIPRRKIIIPNPYYEAPTQKKNMQVTARFFPDLSIQDNQRLEISPIEIQGSCGLFKETIKEIGINRSNGRNKTDK